jgi:L-methionine (R)-S-oxide reductase
MPHADSSYFAAGASKEEVYTQVLEQATGLVTGQRNWVSNLANVASLLWHAYASLPKPSSGVNWAGFYVRDDFFPLLASPQRSNSISGLTTTIISTSYASPHDRKLLLGPFQGKPACQEIRFGRGVCGTAAQKKETVVVPDVLEFPGHIACDADSRSEIVVPILFDGEVCRSCQKEYETTADFSCARRSPLSISIAPSPRDSTTWIRSIWSN